MTLMRSPERCFTTQRPSHRAVVTVPVRRRTRSPGLSMRTTSPHRTPWGGVLRCEATSDPSLLSRGKPNASRLTTSLRPRPIMCIDSALEHRNDTFSRGAATHAASTQWDFATPKLCRRTAVSAPVVCDTAHPSRTRRLAMAGATTLVAAKWFSLTLPAQGLAHRRAPLGRALAPRRASRAQAMHRRAARPWRGWRGCIACTRRPSYNAGLVRWRTSVVRARARAFPHRRSRRTVPYPA